MMVDDDVEKQNEKKKFKDKSKCQWKDFYTQRISFQKIVTVRFFKFSLKHTHKDTQIICKLDFNRMNLVFVWWWEKR